MAKLTFKPGNDEIVINSSGELPAVGSHAPDFSLVNGRLEEVSLATYAGKRKILNIVPSLIRRFVRHRHGHLMKKLIVVRIPYY